MRHESVGDLCKGRWESVLRSLGVDEKFLKNRHGPCPICKTGTDRYRFDNKESRGTYFCSQCGAGDGVDLLRGIFGWSFKQTSQEIQKVVGVSLLDAPRHTFDDEQKRLALRRVCQQSKRVSVGDLVWSYLAGRVGIRSIPDDLRFHHSLHYDNATCFPAMLAIVRLSDGTPLNVHRTWLDGKGGKAPVDQPKKLMAGPAKNGSIHLFAAGEELGVSEGIETALAASMIFGIPVWAAVSANGVKDFEPPKGVRKVTVFADNDLNFTGQDAAYALAKRLAAAGLETNVLIPAAAGSDWADVQAEEMTNVA